MAERRFYQGETFANYDPGELLENAEFEDCVFDHCRWLGTRVQNCRFNACTFDHCNFSGVVFSFTTMKDAWLLNSAFRSMAWGGLQGKSGVFQCNLVRRTEKGRLRRRGWGLRWEKAQKGGKGTNLRGFFED